MLASNDLRFLTDGGSCSFKAGGCGCGSACGCGDRGCGCVVGRTENGKRCGNYGASRDVPGVLHTWNAFSALDVYRGHVLDEGAAAGADLRILSPKQPEDCAVKEAGSLLNRVTSERGGSRLSENTLPETESDWMPRRVQRNVAVGEEADRVGYITPHDGDLLTYDDPNIPTTLIGGGGELTCVPAVPMKECCIKVQCAPIGLAIGPLHCWIELKGCNDDEPSRYEVWQWGDQPTGSTNPFPGQGHIIRSTGDRGMRMGQGVGGGPPSMVLFSGCFLCPYDNCEPVETPCDCLISEMASYPWGNEYNLPPLPNSNTFVMYVAGGCGLVDPAGGPGPFEAPGWEAQPDPGGFEGSLPWPGRWVGLLSASPASRLDRIIQFRILRERYLRQRERFSSTRTDFGVPC